LVEIVCIFQVSGAHGIVGHDRGGILERVADVAISVVSGDVVAIWIGQVSVPLFAVVSPGDVALNQRIANRAQRGRRNREYRLVGVADIGIGIAAVTVVAGVVVVEQVIVSGGAVGLYRPAERIQVVEHLANAWCILV
jgi:hypothetical protein